jgi:4-hydroxy-tetrahydrodipicolinate synthase
MPQMQVVGGVWSATPTPFTNDLQVDTVAVKRLVDHHRRLGVSGLFLAGTCGEGAWMTDRQKQTLVESVVKHAKGKLLIAVQVTDNSAARILDNIRAAKENGADLAVIAPPFFMVNATPANVLALYTQAIRESTLPVGVYDRGKYSNVQVADAILPKIYAEKNVVLIKDSSTDAGRRDIALAARRKRPGLRLLTGYEFEVVSYLQAGYDGLLLGGGIFNGYLARLIMDAVAAGKLPLAERLQRRLVRMNQDAYGGKKLSCWLSGLKKLMVEMGVFRSWKSYLNYPLSPSCIKAIQRMVKKDADVLFPQEN